MRFLDRIGFLGSGGSGGSGGGGCGLTANIVFNAGASDDGPVPIAGSHVALGAGGFIVPVPLTVPAENFGQGISGIFILNFDRIGCSGSIDFELTATPGMIDQTISDTQLFTTYTLPANKSVSTVILEYNRFIQPGVYTLAVEARCGICFARDELTVTVTGNYKGYGYYGGLALGADWLEQLAKTSEPSQVYADSQSKAT